VSIDSDFQANDIPLKIADRDMVEREHHSLVEPRRPQHFRE
jgi:hypothetical protein